MVQRFDVGARLSEMAVHNGVCYLAGQVPSDATQDINGQTRQVLAAIDALLERAGTDKSKILMTQIFLADLADFPGMNAAWDAWVVAGQTPPRATVQVLDGPRVDGGAEVRDEGPATQGRGHRPLLRRPRRTWRRLDLRLVAVRALERPGRREVHGEIP